MPLAADTKLGPYEIGVPLGTGEMGEVYRARDRILMATLRSNRMLLEGTGKGVRHVNLRSAAEVNRPGVKKVIAEAAKLNRKDPPPGMMVGMEKSTLKQKRGSEVRKGIEIATKPHPDAKQFRARAKGLDKGRGNMIDQLYDLIGGRPMIAAATESFYRRVLEDETLRHFFDSADMAHLREGQSMFISMLLGGRIVYTGKKIDAAHAGARFKGLTDKHFDRFLTHFRAALAEVGVKPDKAEKVMPLLEAQRDAVLGR